MRTQQRVNRETGNIVAALLRAASANDPERAAAILRGLPSNTSVRAAVGGADTTALPVWLQPLAQQYHTALDLGQPHQAIRLLGSLLDVNDKSVDRRLPDANLQAHLTRRSHVPEIGEVVVVPKDHRRQRHTVTVDLELLVDVVEVLPGQPAGAQVPEPPVVSRDIARSSIVCSNDIIVNAYRLQQARAHNLQNGPGLAGAPKPKSTRSYVSLVAFVYLLQFTTSPTAIRYLSGNTQKTAKRTALRATLYTTRDTTYVLWCEH